MGQKQTLQSIACWMLLFRSNCWRSVQNAWVFLSSLPSYLHRSRPGRSQGPTAKPPRPFDHFRVAPGDFLRRRRDGIDPGEDPGVLRLGRRRLWSGKKPRRRRPRRRSSRGAVFPRSSGAWTPGWVEGKLELPPSWGCAVWEAFGRPTWCCLIRSTREN